MNIELRNKPTTPGTPRGLTHSSQKKEYTRRIQSTAVLPERKRAMWAQKPVPFTGQSQRETVIHSRPVQAVTLGGVSVKLAAPSCSPPEGFWI